jgi:hypothetical protein
MYLTIFSIISFITNAFLIFYVIKQNSSLKELEIKLKITKDYANQQAEKVIAKTRNFVHENKEKIKSVKQVIENAKEEVKEQVAQAPKKRRGRRKKNTNVQ